MKSLTKTEIEALLKREKNPKQKESWVAPYARMVYDAIEEGEYEVAVSQGYTIVVREVERGRYHLSVKGRFVPCGVFDLQRLRSLGETTKQGRN